MSAKFGFTGTRAGMTREQRSAFGLLMDHHGGEGFMHQYRPEFHHGDCIGSDFEAHNIAHMFEWRIVLHPPSNSSQRAFCSADEEREPKPYLDRNKDIVNETAVLIATPGEMEEQLRSGTWSTIRYARKKGKRIIVLYPDGSMNVEN